MIEWVAVISSLLCVWLTTKRNIWCWPIGIIGIIFYAILFHEKSDWANFILQFIFLGQSIMGWINWKNYTDINTTSLSIKDKLKVSVIGLLLLIPVYYFTINFNGNLPLLDSITTVLSLLGMFLLARNKVDSWYCWILADILYISFFLQNKLPVSAGLYLVFLILAIYGWWSWKKNLWMKNY